MQRLDLLFIEFVSLGLFIIFLLVSLKSPMLNVVHRLRSHYHARGCTCVHAPMLMVVQRLCSHCYAWGCTETAFALTCSTLYSYSQGAFTLQISGSFIYFIFIFQPSPLYLLQILRSELEYQQSPQQSLSPRRETMLNVKFLPCSVWAVVLGGL